MKNIKNIILRNKDFINFAKFCRKINIPENLDVKRFLCSDSLWQISQEDKEIIIQYFYNNYSRDAIRDVIEISSENPILEELNSILQEPNKVKGLALWYVTQQ